MSAEAVRELAARRRLPESHLGRWLAMDSASRDALLDVAAHLRLRTGQLVATIDLLDEISVREGVCAAAILARDSVRRAAAGAGSLPTRAASFLDAVRAIRFPRLQRAMERISAELAALRLPTGIAVVLPKDLHSDELMVRIHARTGNELRKLIESLAEKKSGLVRLAELLSGDDEV